MGCHVIEVASTGFVECVNAAHVWGGEPQAFLVKDACMLPSIVLSVFGVLWRQMNVNAEG